MPPLSLLLKSFTSSLVVISVVVSALSVVLNVKEKNLKLPDLHMKKELVETSENPQICKILKVVRLRWWINTKATKAK